MDRFLTVTASTKRAPAISGGKRGTPTTKISSLLCTPLDPVDPELRQRLALNTPHELLQTFVKGALDILEGDILVVGANEYPIRSCAEWTWESSRFLRLVLEDLKR
jgi:hypothetical protein